MPVMTLERPKNIPTIPTDIEEVEYPQELIDKWNKEFENVKSLYVTGKIHTQTVKEFAAEFGIDIDDD